MGPIWKSGNEPILLKNSNFRRMAHSQRYLREQRARKFNYLRGKVLARRRHREHRSGLNRVFQRYRPSAVKRGCVKRNSRTAPKARPAAIRPSSRCLIASRKPASSCAQGHAIPFPKIAPNQL